MGLHQPSRTHLAPRPLCRPFLFLKASQTRNIRNMICHGAQPCVCCMLSHFSHVQLFVTPWTVAYQAPLSMGFSKQEYWSGLPCPPSRGSSQPRNPIRVSCIFCITGGFFTTEPPGKPTTLVVVKLYHSEQFNGQRF